jgi:predicted acyl esterase
VPVLLCAHPYGKDLLPRRIGRRSRFLFQYSIMRQPTPVSFSTLTGWEAPDPNWWVVQGYAVVNCDLRGAGTSDGVGRDSPTLIADLAWSELFSESVDRFLRIAPERRRRAGFQARREP